TCCGSTCATRCVRASSSPTAATCAAGRLPASHRWMRRPRCWPPRVPANRLMAVEEQPACLIAVHRFVGLREQRRQRRWVARVDDRRANAHSKGHRAGGLLPQEAAYPCREAARAGKPGLGEQEDELVATVP